MNTVFSLMDVFSMKQIAASHAPYALSPVPGPKASLAKSWTTKFFGVNVVPDLGILTTSIASMTDTPIIQRSWGLLGGSDFYGPNFTFSEYMKSRNYLTATLFHFGLVSLSLLLAIPFLRTFARKFVYQPGEGQTKEEAMKDRVEYRGIATPDIGTPKPPRAFCRASYQGSLYACK